MIIRQIDRIEWLVQMNLSRSAIVALETTVSSRRFNQAHWREELWPTRFGRWLWAVCGEAAFFASTVSQAQSVSPNESYLTAYAMTPNSQGNVELLSFAMSACAVGDVRSPIPLGRPDLKRD